MASYIEVIAYLVLYSVIFASLLFLLRNRNVAGRTLKEYIKPVSFCLIGAMVGVSIGYMSFFEVETRLVVHQVIWATMVAVSALILVYYRKFNMKNMVVLGVIYSLWIHGAKCSLRYIVYGAYEPSYRAADYIIRQFTYGSTIVFVEIFIVTLAILLDTEIKKKEKDTKQISLLILGIAAMVAVLFGAANLFTM
ncbi:MAG: hypothetical protein WC325_03590 [Candidatus Bathyarchaeia archaeon]|jgi:hypothetical protein